MDSSNSPKVQVDESVGLDEVQILESQIGSSSGEDNYKIIENKEELPNNIPEVGSNESDSEVEESGLDQEDVTWAEKPVVIPRYEDIKDANVDDFGFFHSDAESQKSGSTKTLSLRKYRQRESKWVDILLNWDEFFRKNPLDLKYLCRKGLPVSVRGRVWCSFAKVDLFRKEGLYNELLLKGSLEIYDVIERDINRCYPDHFFFKDKDALGQKHLFDVLKAYAHYNPSVGYCQGMGRLVGMMLMQMPAEDTFWLLVATLENYLKDYYTPNLDRFRIHAMVFEKLLHAYLPALSKHLIKNDVPPLIYMTQWFLTVYTMVLPWDTVLRVWDMFYCEGIKVLFRIGLAVLSKVKGYILRHCPSSTEIMQFLLHIPVEYLGLDLIDVALSINLSRKEVEKIESKATELWQQEGSPNRGTLTLLKTKKS